MPVTDTLWEWKVPALQADGTPQPGNGWMATWPEAAALARKWMGMCIVHVMQWLKDKADFEDKAAHYEGIKNDVMSLSNYIWHPGLIPIAYKVS